MSVKNENALVSVVIVNWNGRKWLGKCLKTLSNQTYKNLEIIVVDNASSDDSIRFINKEFPNTKIIKNNENLGFSKANNIGIRSSSGSHILLINNDTWVDQDFIEKLFKFYTINNLDVLGPKERHYDGSKFLDNYSPIDFLGSPVYSVVSETNKLFALSGVCLFFKKDVYKETKGLDNDFFMYFEDVDWFWRLQLLGRTFAIAKDIFVYHFGSGSSTLELNRNSFLWRNENMLQMLIKNYSLIALIIVLPIYFVQNLVEMAFFTLTLKPRLAYTYLEGWAFNLKNLKRTLKKRRWIQSQRRVGDLSIIENMTLYPNKLSGLLNYLK